MLSSVALAAPETRQVGPYKVSFDMNTNMKYEIQTPNSQSAPLGTISPLLIKTDNSTYASVVITEYKNSIDSTLQMQEALNFYKMRERGINATIPSNMTIGGNDGFLITGVPFTGTNAPAGFKAFQAQYWLDSKSYGPVSAGKVVVDITSTYPQDVTMNLLNSIKVVKSA
jgi:hypothetical protein